MDGTQLVKGVLDHAVLEAQGKTWAAFAATMDGLLDEAGVRS